jgi:hypothetical protein
MHCYRLYAPPEDPRIEELSDSQCGPNIYVQMKL